MFELYDGETLKSIFTLLWNSDMEYTVCLFWGFLFIFICIYLLIGKQTVRKYWVLIGSIVFYIWNGIGAFIIVLGTAIVVYITARMIEQTYQGYEQVKEGLTLKEQRAVFSGYKKKAARYLHLAFILIIGLWLFVKFSSVLELSVLRQILSLSVWGGVIVPLGISYYTLSSIGYLADIYWKKEKAEHNFLNLFSAMIYFPHIVQGPISKYSKIIEQMKELPSVNYNRVCYGLQLMLWGYGKKLIVANHIATYTTVIFANPTEYAGIEVLAAIVLCVIQIYADFSGCVDIVRGISEVIGIELQQNFEQPFLAKSAQEFWSRWHMSLGIWTKDYIYFPIAVNHKFTKYIHGLKREGKTQKADFIFSFFPLVTVWLFTGLWHGTGVDYILWGLYWCVLMTLSKELKPLSYKLTTKLSINTEKNAYKIWCMLRTTILFAIGRMFTVTGQVTGILILIKQMVLNHDMWIAIRNGELYAYLKSDSTLYKSLLVALIVAVIGTCIMIGIDILHERNIKVRETISNQHFWVRWLIYYLAIMVVIILGKYGATYDATSFIYGGF